MSTISNPDLNFADWLREVKDYPKEGVLFRDITPAIANYVAFPEVIDWNWCNSCQHSNQ